MITKQKKQINNVRKNFAYPYISSDKKILNGTPVVTGTRVAIRTIAGYYQMGMNVDEILNTLSHLTASQVHSALAYYFDHQEEVDKAIRENNEIYDSEIARK